MKKLRVAAIFLAIALVCEAPFLWAKDTAKTQKICWKHCADVIYLKGDDITARKVDEQKWVVAFVNMPDYLHDSIKTGDKSVATIEFVNGSQIGINKGTEIWIESESSAKDVTKRSLPKKITLKAGALWAKLRKAEAEENLQFHTRGGVIGVKGTEFVLEETKDKTRISVLGGQVDYMSEGKTTPVPAGSELEDALGTAPQVFEKGIEELRKILNQGFPDLDPALNSMKSVFGELENMLKYVTQDLGPMMQEAAEKMKEKMKEALEKMKKAPEMKGNKEVMKGVEEASEAMKNMPNFPGSMEMPSPGEQPKTQPPSQPPGASGQRPTNLQILEIGGKAEGLLKTYFPTFSWKGLDKAPSQYRVIVSRAGSAAPEKSGKDESPQYVWNATVSGKTTVTYPAKARPLHADQTYFWVVIPENLKGDKPERASSPSEPASFKLAQEGDLGVRGIVPTGDVLAGNDLVFEWISFPDAARYRIRIGEKESISPAAHEGNASVSYYVLVNWAKVLSKGKTYYWRVDALDEAGKPVGVPGPILQFKVADKK
ncbi:MAG: FecR domain-containing protein [Armatimonadetes bacterium]|nr:FecR domain-containing protein [Armatimonadota bacterium]